MASRQVGLLQYNLIHGKKTPNALTNSKQMMHSAFVCLHVCDPLQFTPETFNRKRHKETMEPTSECYANNMIVHDRTHYLQPNVQVKCIHSRSCKRQNR